MLRKIPGLERVKVTWNGKTVAHLGASYLVILTKYYMGGEIK
jgi:hypothetical protein